MGNGTLYKLLICPFWRGCPFLGRSFIRGSTRANTDQELRTGFIPDKEVTYPSGVWRL